MKESTARLTALILFIVALVINILGYTALPAELSIEMFGSTPLPSLIVLGVGQALILLVAFRLATAQEDSVRGQMAVILGLLVLADAVLVAIGAGLF
ncbi:MAG: hypothetical protein ACOYI3_02500 [Christensenellales bacterium]|jgi:uncharacterized membrane protein